MLIYPLDVTGGQVTRSAQDVKTRLQKKGMMGNKRKTTVYMILSLVVYSMSLLFTVLSFLSAVTPRLTLLTYFR